MKKGFQRAFALSFAQLFLAAALAACGPVGNDSSPAHVHTLTEVPAVDARCEKDGNIAYWECDDCGKYFSDALGQTEISAEDVVIPAGHKPEAVQAVTADKMFACDSVAYYRCTVCGKTFSDEDCKTEITADDIFEQKTFLLSTAQVSVPETTSRVYATVNEADYTLAVEETHFAMRVFLGWEIGDADFKTLIDEMEEEHLEFRLNLNIDTEGTLANGQWYHFKLGYDADGAFGGFSDSDAFVHFNLLKNGGNAIEEAFLENGGVYVTLLRNGGQMIAYVEDLEGNLFELVRTTCFGDTPMARVSLGVNQGFVADSRYPATAKDGKLVIGTADPYLPQTAQENPGDIVDEPPAPPERVLSVGEPYDPGAALWGQPASYEIAQEGEGFRISWADGRGNWAKVYQNVTGYAEEEGKYLRLTFSVERTTDVYVLYRETADAEEETALGRADYEAGEHTVYLPLPDGAGSEFVIEYYLDAKANPVAAGSVLLSGADFVADRPAVPTEIGGMYDAASSVGNPRAYEIAEADGETSVSWADGRGPWEYVRQDVTGYKAENGYFRMTFTLARKTKVGVYMNGNALLGHTDYEAGTHTVYIEMPENTAENFTLDYYFDGGVSPVAAGKAAFSEFRFVSSDRASIGIPYDLAQTFGQKAEFTVEEQDGNVVVSWQDGRSEWAKLWQDVSGYSADKGRYIQLSFFLSRKTNLYICYVPDASGQPETQMMRSDYEAGAHTVCFPVGGAAENFIIEYYLDAGAGTIQAGSMTITGIAFVDRMPVSLGGMYDVSASLGLARQYTVESGENGSTVVGWTAARDAWAKLWQDVAGYSAESGRYLKLTFTLAQKTKIGVFLNDGTALLGHTEYEAGVHTVYVEIPAGAGENFVLEYYFDAGVSPMTSGSVTFTEISFAAEKE